MEEVYICEMCQRAYELEKINGVWKHKEFKGYTVDLRLGEFRRIFHGGCMEFIPFNIPEGQKLLAQMHEEVTQ